MVAAPRGYRNVTITFGLLGVPVKLVTTGSEEEDVTFTNVHRDCGGRVKMPKQCNKCEALLGSADLQAMYEYVEGRYVEITDADIEALPQADKKVIELSEFVEAASIDPILHGGTYYLYPQPSGMMQYELMARTLAAKGRVGLGRVTLTTRESLCQIRPMGDGLVLDLLRWPAKLKEQPQRDAVEPTQESLEIAGAYVDLLTSPFDPSRHVDTYQNAVREMVAAKLDGKPLEKAAAAPAALMPDIMTALRASLEAAKAARQPEPETKAKRKRKAA